jgi:filamentous hemagglutinin family protein
MLIQLPSQPQSIKQRFGEAACFCLLMVTQPALANPTGGQVVSGSATITPPGNAVTTIQQHSVNAVIHWQDFSIGAHETTQFIQPSAQSIAVNRVMGGNPSKIMGNLKANGNIYLLNSNGILFGKGSKVDVGGLVASTAKISDQAIFSGKPMKFSPGNPGASIINEGTISIKNAGLAVLVAPTVVNKGIIEANLGKVVIAAAEHFTFDPYGDNLITFDAGPAATDLLLENAGTIQADGGRVYLTAQATGALLQNLINMTGYIQAQSIKEQNGRVVLEGHENTTVQIAGKIDVSGKVPGLTGGQAQITGENVHLQNDSLIDASGISGGGTVNIGGEFQGRGALAHATDLVMETGSLITADALHQGDGGTISLWSDNTTQAWGTLTARGGAQGGNGGMIETSSHQTLDTSGSLVNASAAHGLAGTWLIDPITLFINDAVAASYNTSLAAGTNVTISTSDQVQFNNTTTNISWGTGANFSLRSNSSANSIALDPNTITYSGFCTAGVTCQVISSGAGNIDFFYNPLSYAAPTSFTNFVQTLGLGNFNPYMLVNTAAEMQDLNTNLAGTYALNTDVDLSSIANFQSIGGEGGGDFMGIFTGNIQGNQYTVSNLNITSVFIKTGLFGSVNSPSAVISDVVLTNPIVHNVTTGDTGALIGSIASGTVSGTITVNNPQVGSSLPEAGGIIGNASGGTLSANFTVNSGAGSFILGDFNVGGIIGNATGVTISDTASFTNNGVQVQSLINGAGGLFGNIAGVTWNVTALCSNSGVITTHTGVNAGGIAGNANFNFSNPFSNSGAVMGGSGNNIGGIFGQYTGTGTGSLSNSADVTATSNSVGGIVGNFTGGSLTNVAMTGTQVSGNTNVGGVAGSNAGTLTNATVSGTSISGNTSVGGIAGDLTGSITIAAVSSANVSGTTAVGGIAGTNEAAGNITQGLVSKSTISGTNQVGGIAGNNQGIISASAAINYLTNITTVSGASGGSAIGGIAGLNAGSIQNASFAGYVLASGASAVGGVVGQNTGTLQYALSTAFVTGGSTVGALVGDNSIGAILASFYDTTFNPGLLGIGLGSNTGAIAGNYTTLGNIATYTAQGWNPAIWQVLTSLDYASLIWCGSSCAVVINFPPVTTSVTSIITQQLVNAENTYRIGILYTLYNGVTLANTDLNIIPALSLLSQLNIIPTSPNYEAVVQWLTDTTVLQWLDVGSPGNQTQYVLDALKGAVKALQNAQHCS